MDGDIIISFNYLMEVSTLKMKTHGMQYLIQFKLRNN